MFNVNFKILIKLLIPVRLRMPKALAWMYALVAPLETVYNGFKSNRNYNNYWLTHTPQVCYVEAVLNDRWDAGLRRIKILDGVQVAPFWAGQLANNDSDFAAHDADPVLQYAPDNAAVLDGCDAIIQVPSFIVFSMAEMKALIDKYRLVGKRNYKIMIV